MSNYKVTITYADGETKEFITHDGFLDTPRNNAEVISIAIETAKEES